jgi:murein L,D-transpeptidase YafK
MFASVAYAEKADLVIVSKAESRLYLERAGKRFASFEVAFGGNPRGHKQQEGDERTPEGKYVLDSKNPNSRYYKAVHISYPNAQDRASAQARGVRPGGLVMIHGQKNGFGWLSPITQLFDWTDGCIALSNADMETVWQAIAVGTPIEIHP